MKQQLIIVATCISLAMASCVSKTDYESLEAERDALKSNLMANDSLNNVLSKELSMVETLMDSIDASQNSLTYSLESGTNYEDFQQRVNGLKAYIQSSDDMIRNMEQKLSNSTAKNSSLNTIIRKLRTELDTKQKMVLTLQESVEEYRGKNEELVRLNDVQKAEILDQENRLAARKAELQRLEASIVDMQQKAKVETANAYYQQGLAMEEVAKRTNFAPKKKKAAYKDAADFFKLAFENGHLEAKKKMDEMLEKAD